MNNELINNIHLIHTTKLGEERIKKNLNITGDVINYIRKLILSKITIVTKKGKNYYIKVNNIQVTINSFNYCVITAHIKKYKYIVLDFGGVIAHSPSRDWDMTPKFIELIDLNKLDMNKFNVARKKYSYMLSEDIFTLEEEYDMFKRFYGSIFSEIDYPYTKEMIEAFAYDRTYNNNKYELFNGVANELKMLKKNHKLLMLTDNWPCVFDYLKANDLDKYFDKIYVSSIYGTLKKNKDFFDYPINDYNIKPGEALFIDDTEALIDIAKEKGFDVFLMDRDNIVKESNHEIINNLMIRGEV